MYAKACQSRTNFTKRFIIISLLDFKVSSHYIQKKKGQGLVSNLVGIKTTKLLKTIPE